MIVAAEKAGDPIPGSRYVRAFCPSCRQPMRVSRETFQRGPMLPCSDCDICRGPTNSTVAAARERHLPFDEGETNAWHNVVRCIEDHG